MANDRRGPSRLHALARVFEARDVRFSLRRRAGTVSSPAFANRREGSDERLRVGDRAEDAVLDPDGLDGPPVQAVVVHAFWSSSQLPGTVQSWQSEIGEWEQTPVCGLQEASSQALLSLQGTGVPGRHLFPAPQISTPLQRSPSLQSAAVVHSRRTHMPEVGSQRSMAGNRCVNPPALPVRTTARRVRAGETTRSVTSVRGSKPVPTTTSWGATATRSDGFAVGPAEAASASTSVASVAAMSDIDRTRRV